MPLYSEKIVSYKMFVIRLTIHQYSRYIVSNTELKISKRQHIMSVTIILSIYSINVEYFLSIRLHILSNANAQFK